MVRLTHGRVAWMSEQLFTGLVSMRMTTQFYGREVSDAENESAGTSIKMGSMSGLEST